jgi:hypothetical protein
VMHHKPLAHVDPSQIHDHTKLEEALQAGGGGSSAAAPVSSVICCWCLLQGCQSVFFYRILCSYVVRVGGQWRFSTRCAAG